MKKFGKVLIATIVALGLLVACGGDNGNGGDDNGTAETGGLKVGIGSVQVVNVNDDNEAAFDTVIAGVALKDDKIVHVSIDHSQQKAVVEGDEAKMELADTKGVKKEAYEMKEASELGKEWFEQVDALEKELVGKTKDEVIAYLGGDDVKTTASIAVEDFQAAVIKAIDTAVEVEGATQVGFGFNLSVKGDDKGAQSVVDFAIVAVDADGKIVKAVLDNAQEKATLTDGKLVAANIGKTKGELKEGYAMKEASPIGKEWNEQNDAFMEALVGKTLAEAAGLKPAEGDIATSVTIGLDSAQAALAAAGNALVDVK